MQYRRRFDILADVVKAATPAAKKTRIMFFANLSYALLKRYLEEAVSLGFLKANANEFVVTQRGENFLAKYSAFKSDTSYVKSEIDKLRSEAELLEQMCKLRKVNGRAYRRSRLTVLR